MKTQNKTKTNLIIITVLILALMLAVSACGSEKTVEETVIVPPPTWTPTPTPQNAVAKDKTPTQAPTATPAPTSTPIPPTPAPPAAAKVEAVVTADKAGVYKGPDSKHPRLGVAKKDEKYPVLAKNDKGTWWQIDFNGEPGWIFAKRVKVENADSIPVAENIPTPPPKPTAKPKKKAVLVVTAPQANLRQGPSTTHPKAGVVKKGEKFPILGKNKAGDWWQIEYKGKPAWIYNTLVKVENADGVKVAQNIPTPPPAPTRAPAPTATNTPPPPAPDPCANIGGDGCKWHIRSGPAFAANPYGLKLTFGFVHGGRGDEPQGSYFVWLEKNGAKLPISDSVRSWSGAMSQGPNGPYNYEYSLGLGDIPDHNLAGCYTGWVLDGNGERDSKNFQFCVPEGQGEVWILFDQS